MPPVLIYIDDIEVYGFWGHLCLPDMAGDIWPLPDPDVAVRL